MCIDKICLYYMMSLNLSTVLHVICNNGNIAYIMVWFNNSHSVPIILLLECLYYTW